MHIKLKLQKSLLEKRDDVTGVGNDDSFSYLDFLF